MILLLLSVLALSDVLAQTECVGNTCNAEIEICVAEPKQQYRCQNVCTPNPCPSNQQYCYPDAKTCTGAPCNQYRCSDKKDDTTSTTATATTGAGTTNGGNGISININYRSGAATTTATTSVASITLLATAIALF